MLSQLKSWLKKMRSRADTVGAPGRAMVATPDQRAFWNENGFLILEGFFTAAQVDEVNSLVDDIQSPDSRKKFGDITVDPLTGRYIGGRMQLETAPDEIFEGPIKINDLYLRSDTVRGLALDETLAGILADLMEGEPAICNSLNFIRGSQQAAHIDTWFMAPPDEKRLIVTSICLEDVTPDAGPLFYYPGSQKIPPYRFSTGKLNAVGEELPAASEYVDQQLTERGLEKTVFHGKKGDVFIWSAQLVHGGSEIADLTKSRRSLVTHYFAADDLPSSMVKTVGPGRDYYDREPLPALTKALDSL